MVSRRRIVLAFCLHSRVALLVCGVNANSIGRVATHSSRQRSEQQKFRCRRSSAHSDVSAGECDLSIITRHVNDRLRIVLDAVDRRFRTNVCTLTVYVMPAKISSFSLCFFPHRLSFDWRCSAQGHTMASSFFFVLCLLSSFSFQLFIVNFSLTDGDVRGDFFCAGVCS
jgi:hypothetical protein